MKRFLCFFQLLLLNGCHSRLLKGFDTGLLKRWSLSFQTERPLIMGLLIPYGLPLSLLIMLAEK